MELNCSVLLNNISERQNYKNLKFGGSPAVCIGLLGKASTKSIEKILQTYRIPKGELIAAHLTKKVLLMIDGVLITDKALYVNPDHCPRGMANRIPWSELPMYFVAHPNETAATILYRPGNLRYLLLHPTFLDKVSGNELTAFLLEMQSEIMKAAPELQVDRQSVFQSLKDECTGTLMSNVLSDDQRSILENLLSEPLLSEEAVQILAENCARLYPYLQYEQWIESLSSNFPSAFRQKLSEMWETITAETIYSLENNCNNFSLELLSEIYKNYISNDISSVIEANVAEHLCVRLRKWTDIDQIVQILETQHMDNAISDLYSAKFKDANSQMQEVIHTIQAEKYPLNGEMANYRDSMGLTPFHYALISGHRRAQLAVVQSKKYPELPENQITAFDNIGIYDLFTLAVFKELPYSDLRKMVLQTDAGAKHLQKIVSAMRAQGVAVNVIEVFLNCALTAADMAARNGYNVDLSREQYRNFSGAVNASDKTISEATDQVWLARFELENYIEDTIQAAQQRIERWKHSKNQAVQYLLHIYSDPGYLEKMLSSNGGWTLYDTFDGFLYMAPTGEIESHYLPVDSISEEITEIEKLFGDSWFSEEAHMDITVLKKEFRGLAKKYHPDISDTAQASAIFKDISAEYDHLQEQYENAD